MRMVRISEEVWAEIAKRGKFGETEDDVLRREFKLPAAGTSTEIRTSDVAQRGASRNDVGVAVTHARGVRRRSSYATTRMSSYVNSGMLHVGFEGGREQSWPLPDRNDKLAIRQVRDQAVDFARRNGATLGQENAVKKALTDSGYHLIK